MVRRGDAERDTEREMGRGASGLGAYSDYHLSNPFTSRSASSERREGEEENGGRRRRHPESALYDTQVCTPAPSSSSIFIPQPYSPSLLNSKIGNRHIIRKQ